jgi:hypothetical protein
MSFLSFLGWPDCAATGCGNPALVRVELDGPAGPIWADLCFSCMGEFKRILGTLEDVQKESEDALPPTSENEPPAGYLS